MSANEQEDKVKIKLTKFWQTEENTLFWQINPYSPQNKDLYPKKAFLSLALTPKVKAEVTLDKPERLKPSGQFVSLLRKHCPSGSLLNIYRSKEGSKTIIFEIGSGGSFHYIAAEDSRPPMISLNTGDPLASVCRLTPKSCYTKKQEPSSYDLEKFTKVNFSDFLKDIELNVFSNIEKKDILETSESKAEFSVFQKESLKRLKRKLKTLKKSLTKAEGSALSEDEIKILKFKAKMLHAFSYLIKPGDYELKLDQAQTGQESITIEIDPEKSIGANIDNYFSLSKKVLKGKDINKSRVQKAKKEIQLLTDAINRFENFDLSDTEVESNLEKFGVKAEKQKPLLGSNTNTPKHYREFVTPEGNIYLVGKGPKENDLLTKSARSNDYWVHTSEVAGSHVIIPSKTIKGELSSLQLKEAGMLSIHFSKLREGCAGEVYVTKKHNIRKQKGLAPGLWLVDRSDTFFIRYQPEEIKKLLDCLK